MRLSACICERRCPHSGKCPAHARDAEGAITPINQSSSRSDEHRVIFYYRPGCSECPEATEFLDRAGVRYLAIDSSKDEEALHDLKERWGCSDGAALVVDGEIFAGFHANVHELQKRLGGVDPHVLDRVRWTGEGGPDLDA